MNAPNPADPTTPVEPDPPEDRIDHLIATIKGKIQSYQTEDKPNLQYDFAKLVYFLHRLRKGVDQPPLGTKKIRSQRAQGIIDVIEIAFQLIEHSPTSTSQIRDLRRYAEMEIRSIERPTSANISNGFKVFLYESSTATKVIAGLVIWLVASSTTLALTSPRWLSYPTPNVAVPTKANSSQAQGSGSTLTITTPKPSVTQPQVSAATPTNNTNDQIQLLSLFVVIAGFSGAAGGTVSIFSRVKAFENSSYSDGFLPFIVGFTKPLVSGSFGIFVYALVASQTYGAGFSANIPLEQRICSIAALAFIAGFSERLVPDIITSTEKQNQQLNPSENRDGSIPEPAPTEIPEPLPTPVSPAPPSNNLK